MRLRDSSSLSKFLNEVSRGDYVDLFGLQFTDIDIYAPQNRIKLGQLHSTIRIINQEIQANKQKLESPSYKLVTEISKLTEIPSQDVAAKIQHMIEQIKEFDGNESKFDKLIMGLGDEKFFKKLVIKFLNSKVQLDDCSLFFGKKESFFSAESVIVIRNAYNHPNGDFVTETDKKNFCKSIDNINLVMNTLKPYDLFKILATIYFILGAQKIHYESPPASIDQLWSSENQDTSIDEVKSVLDDLLSGRTWTEYVDQQERKSGLIKELKNGKIVTIYGEGGTGKTELVYQALHDIINQVSLRFDVLLPITFKNDEQGEFTDSGKIVNVEMPGWKKKEKFGQILDILSHKNSREPNDGTDLDERMNRAVEYLVSSNVCLVIDNHETVGAMDQEKPLDTFLDKLSSHPDSANSNSRVIITTRVRPDSTRTGKSIPMKYLNPEEMLSLSKKRASWLAPRHKNREINIPIHEEDTNHWEDLNTWLKQELNTELERQFAGHPRVVFTAVYAAMFENKERKSLKVIIREQIRKATEGNTEDSILDNLMKYITSNSISYIPNLEHDHKSIAELARRHSFSFQTLVEICETYDSDYSVLIRNLEDLDLLRKTNENSHSFRTKYHSGELLEYIEKKYGNTNRLHSKLDWWWSKSQSLNERPVGWDTIRHLLVPIKSMKSNDMEGFTPTIAENFQLLSSGKLHPTDSTKIISLLRQFTSIVQTLSEKETKHKILGDSPDVLANENEFLLFCMYVIEKGLEGFQNYFSELTKPISAQAFERIVSLLTNIREFSVHTVFREDFVQLREDIDRRFNFLLRYICRNLPPYTQETSVPLHNLWRLSEIENHPDECLLNIGMKLLDRTGYSDAKTIFGLIRERICQPEILIGDFFSVHLSLLGEYLWKNIDLVLEPDTILMIEKIEKLLSPRDIFSYETVEIRDLVQTNYGFRGILEDGQSVNAITNRMPSFPRFSVKIQIINREQSTSNNDEFIVKCRLCSEPIEKLIKSPTSQARVIDSKHIVHLSKEQMFEKLNHKPFTDIQAAELLGTHLLAQLKEEGIFGRWKDWKKHHYPEDRDMEQIISELSNGKFTTEYRDSGTNVTIVRTKREKSKLEEKSVKKIIYESHAFSYPPKDTAESFKIKKKIQIKPLRGTPRSQKKSNITKEE